MTEGQGAYVDSPEFLNGIEGHDLFEEVVPVLVLYNNQHPALKELTPVSCLSARWLGEPQSPLVHQRMFDVEIVLVMEDGDWVIGVLSIRGRRILCFRVTGSILSSG